MIAQSAKSYLWQIMQFDGLPLRDPRFVATLSFDELLIPRAYTERVLYDTRTKWQWYVDARVSTPQLGTLGRLPFEIRRLILEYLLHCRATLSSDGIWEYDASLGPVFDVGSYYFGFGRRTLINTKVQSLRGVSSTLKSEYEDVFLTGRTFRFNYGLNLHAFVEGLARQGYHTIIRRLEIRYGGYDVNRLVNFVHPMSNLWPGLREITILMDSISLNSLRNIGDIVVETLREAIVGAANSAPHATINVMSSDTQPLGAKIEAMIESMLARVARCGRHSKVENSLIPSEGYDECN